MSFESPELSVALRAVRRAAELCRKVQEAELGENTRLKDDRSPVTVADLGAQAVVARTLLEAFPEIPIVGEETSAVLRGDGETESGLRRRVTEHVGRTLGGAADEAATLEAIDACSDPGGAVGRRWVLDPIDGTKGYLRRDQYAIALALLEDGEITTGVLGCPALPRSDGSGHLGCLFAARRGHGSYEIGLDDPEAAPAEITCSAVDDPAAAVFCESVEAAHSAHDRHARIADHLGVRSEPFRIDSQCKYAAVARGQASIYLRLPTRPDYREKIWDHAAGWIVVREAGGAVTDVDGRPLDFSRGRTFDPSRGVIATNGALHQAVLEAVRATASDSGAEER